MSPAYLAIVITLLVAFSAFFSGLNLGLMSLSPHELKRKAQLGDINAARLYPLRRRGNLLLSTLLVGNVAVNAILSIFLGSLISGLVAWITATALIVILGEIVPQSIFSRFALALSARSAWLVRLFMFALYPICWPLAFVLDKTLGHELPTIYSKPELVKIIEEHAASHLSDLDASEKRILKGALTFSARRVSDVMTPLERVFTLEQSQPINAGLLEQIRAKGFSRIPVHRKNMSDITGILYIDDLIGSRNIGKKIGEVARSSVLTVVEDRLLDDVFEDFLAERQHLFIVVDSRRVFVGVVTLEDVLEEIIQSDIMDEDDVTASSFTMNT